MPRNLNEIVELYVPEFGFCSLFLSLYLLHSIQCRTRTSTCLASTLKGQCNEITTGSVDTGDNETNVPSLPRFTLIAATPGSICHRCQQRRRRQIATGVNDASRKLCQKSRYTVPLKPQNNTEFTKETSPPPPSF
jgi:hypothetical protein